MSKKDAAILIKGAIAALSQKKTFPGDIDLAKSYLRDALRALSRP